MSKDKEQISKGLRALLGNIDKSSGVEKQEAIKDLANTIAQIPISNISPNPNQPRTEFGEAELLELTQSIKTHGLIQPITVRKLGNQFQIISGERRYRASKLAGLKSLPCYILVTDEIGMLEMAIVENIQRADLNAMEIALSYQRLIDDCDYSHEELSGRVGKERSTVTNYLRLLKLPVKIQTALKDSLLSMGHARALLGLDNPAWQIKLFEEINSKALSVRATEQLVRNWKNNKVKPSTAKSDSQEHPEIRNIRNQLIQLFESKVDIKRKSNGSGQFVIHFSSDDQFNDILEKIRD